MKAYTELLGGADLVVQACAVRKQIQMIGDGRRAREQQLGEPQLGADVNAFAVHLGPQRIQRLQPVEQRQALRRPDCSCQRLVQMVVAIHEPGH